MTTTYDLPHPLDIYDGGYVVASVWGKDDEQEGSTATLLTLEQTPGEHYRVLEIEWRGGSWVTLDRTTYPNIVPAVEAYQERGGDY